MFPLQKSVISKLKATKPKKLSLFVKTDFAEAEYNELADQTALEIHFEMLAAVDRLADYIVVDQTVAPDH